MKTCEACQREFVPTNPKNPNRFCSRDCLYRGLRVVETRKCPECGKGFEATPWLSKKYCGTTCMVRGRATTKRLPPLEKVCPACGTTFTVLRHGGYRKQVLCSMRCQQLSRYRRGGRAKPMELVDSVYLAAFIDGEGWIIIQSRRGVAAIRVGVANTYRPILDWIVEATGVGHVHNGRAATDTHKQAWQWWCESEAAETLLEQVRPYLKIKGAQADLAILTQQRLRDPALKSDRIWQEEYRQQMRAMNRRGPRAEVDITFTAGG